MSRIAPRRLRLLAAAFAVCALSGACARSDASAAGSTAAAAPHAPAAGQATAASAAPSGEPGHEFKDSTSNAADRGRIRGAADSKVWIIEVSDFQCPYCKQWHDQVYPEIDREYIQSGKARIAYINYPLSGIHPNARAAAEASMCASVQGKFWQMHDALFESQDAWAAMKDPLPKFESLAVAAGADASAWRGCMSSHATQAIVDADYSRATSAGVRSTPSFFVNGQLLIGLQPAAAFRAVLDSATRTPAR